MSVVQLWDCGLVETSVPSWKLPPDADGCFAPCCLSDRFGCSLLAEFETDVEVPLGKWDQWPAAVYFGELVDRAGLNA